jgi:death on curing protein
VITWITTAVVLAIHDAQIVEHGGSEGLRDHNLLESALARPRNLFAYGSPRPDLAALAAAYAFGIARNHAFIDGNKRTSLVATQTFVNLNGMDLAADDAEMLQVWSDLGAGNLSEEALADWIRKKLIE